MGLPSFMPQPVPEALVSQKLASRKPSPSQKFSVLWSVVNATEGFDADVVCQ